MEKDAKKKKMTVTIWLCLADAQAHVIVPKDGE